MQAGHGEWFCSAAPARLLGERGRQAEALEVLAPYRAAGGSLRGLGRVTRWATNRTESRLRDVDAEVLGKFTSACNVEVFVVLDVTAGRSGRVRWILVDERREPTCEWFTDSYAHGGFSTEALRAGAPALLGWVASTGDLDVLAGTDLTLTLGQPSILPEELPRSRPEQLHEGGRRP
ncbi:hypothetical protein OG471_40800 [Streptomyces sp. NBC_01336]|uniref:hypothetical protein n=1 Tax=Streptomyces sp. NBC_01336 TaxID=2903829 RepID=UPI002E0E4B81|nr:hypothetical protein OG471_40800 [Streptomyces sp. NBC_01336]